MKLFLLGFVKLFEGVIFSYKHFKIWFLVPLTLWICFFFIFSFELSQLISKQLLNWIFSISNDSTLKDSNFSTFTESIISGIEWGITLLIKILIWYIIGRYMKYIILILLSPMFAYLSEKTEFILSNKAYSFNLKQFIRDILRSISLTIRNIVIESIMIVIGSIVIILIPSISPIILMLLFVLNSYFMGFSYFDYIAERKKLNYTNTLSYMGANKLTLIGFGFAYNLISFIPLADWIFAPIGAASGAVLADNKLPINQQSIFFVR